ncbi:unnamed protein product, partial [Allacma fusca]
MLPSERTKKRKVAAAVAKLLQDIQDNNYSSSIEINSELLQQSFSENFNSVENIVPSDNSFDFNFTSEDEGSESNVDILPLHSLLEKDIA